MEQQLRFLDNTPCGDDLFEGKSQATIANNIAELLLNNSQCKIIGIDGGWGSGKSNVIYQVKEKIKDKFHVYIYDAWGHQEDLQRRSILEELLDDLITNEILPDSWKSKLKSLLSKKREIVTKTIPSISYGIILSAMAIVLVPLFKTISDLYGTHHTIRRIAITAIPLLILLLTYVYYLWKEKSIKKALSKMYFIYKDKQKEDTTFETISEAEPSVREFREWMKNVSSDLQGKKLVLVFDNMDRLPREKVQELWSSIHTFFAESQYDNIRILIPFDREHIKSAFKNEDSKSDGHPTPVDRCFGNDFIDKTFNVVYRVPPPILSDWKGYFETQWEYALGAKESYADYNKVVQIFDLLNNDITPRKIIAFLNELVSLKRLSIYADVPEKYMALFILGKPVISLDPIKEIITPSYLAAIDFLYHNDSEMPKFIASLFYQVPSDKAIEVIFTDKLKRALDENRKDELITISQIPNFYKLLENAIADITNFENASLALYDLSDDKIGSAIQCQNIWECIYKKSGHLNSGTISDAQVILLTKIEDKLDYALSILENIKKSILYNSMDYCKSIDRIHGAGIDIFRSLKPHVIQIDDFIAFVNNKKGDWSKYKMQCAQNEIDKYFEDHQTNIAALTFIPYLKGHYKLDNYIRILEGQIAAISLATSIDTVELLYMRYKEVASKPLKAMMGDERIYAYFISLTQDKDFYADLLAMRISRLNSFSTSYIQNFESALTSNDEGLIKKLSLVLEYYINFGNLLLNVEIFKQYPLYIGVVNELIKNPVGSSKLEVSSILKKYDIICDATAIEEEIFINRLNGWVKFAIDNITVSNVKSIASIRLIRQCHMVDNELTRYILDTLKQSFDQMDSASCSFLENETSYEFKTLLLLDEYKIPQTIVDGIKHTLEQIAKEEIDIPSKTNWNILIERLDKQNRGLIAAFKTIRDIFCSRGNMTLELFLFFNNWLFKYSKLEDRKESLRTIFKSDIIRHEEVLSIIIVNQDQIKNIINVAQEEAIEFKETIEDIIKDSSNQDLLLFAEEIGINPVEEMIEDSISVDSEGKPNDSKE